MNPSTTTKTKSTVSGCGATSDNSAQTIPCSPELTNLRNRLHTQQEPFFARVKTGHVHTALEFVKMCARLNRTSLSFSVRYDHSGYYICELSPKARPVIGENAENNALEQLSGMRLNREALRQHADTVIKYASAQLKAMGAPSIAERFKGGNILVVGSYGPLDEAMLLLERFPGIAKLTFVEIDPRNFVRAAEDYFTLPKEMKTKMHLVCGDALEAQSTLGKFSGIFANNAFVELFYPGDKLNKLWQKLFFRVESGAYFLGVADFPNCPYLRPLLRIPSPLNAVFGKSK